MKFTKRVFSKSLCCISLIFFAFAHSYSSAQDLREMEVVYSPSNMDDVKIQKEVVYKTTDEKELSIDLYYPPDMKEDEKRPAVIFALGYPEFNLKDMQQYISWGKLAAMNGQVGINYQTTEPETDLADLINYIRKNADELGIDKERLGIWSCSGNIPVALSYLSDYEGDFLKFGVFYYGAMSTPDQRYQPQIDSLSNQYGFSNPHLSKNDQFPTDLPLLLVRAGRDETPNVNNIIDHFLSVAVSDNLPITFINYREGQHAFDILDDNRESRNIIKQTLSFMNREMEEIDNPDNME